MNRLASTITAFTMMTLIAACAVDPIYIERRLPLPLEPQVPPIRMQIGEKLTIGIARDITIRDYLLRDYTEQLKIIIKSTWDNDEKNDN